MQISNLACVCVGYWDTMWMGPCRWHYLRRHFVRYSFEGFVICL